MLDYPNGHLPRRQISQLVAGTGYPTLQITVARTGGGKNMLADPSQIPGAIKSMMPEQRDKPCL